MLVIPATQEAEAGEFLNPGGGDCSEPGSHHCNPAGRPGKTPSQEGKKKKPYTVTSSGHSFRNFAVGQWEAGEGNQ